MYRRRHFVNHVNINCLINWDPRLCSLYKITCICLLKYLNWHTYRHIINCPIIFLYKKVTNNSQIKNLQITLKKVLNLTIFLSVWKKLALNKNVKKSNKAEILRDKTMNDKFIYYHNDDKQKKPFCRLIRLKSFGTADLKFFRSFVLKE